MPHQRLRGIGQRMRFQGAGKQPRGVQGLQQIVADRRQKAGLGEVGSFGLGIGRQQPSIHAPQFVQRTVQGIGALAHLLGQQHRAFERGIRGAAGAAA